MARFGLTICVFALLFCLASPVRGQGSEKILVSFVGSKVTFTCPTPNTALWKKNESGWERLLDCPSASCTIADYQGTRHNGRYRCGLNGTNIYLHARECPGCLEMDAWVVTGIMAADLLVTLGVLILTYHCSRKRAAHFGGGGPAAGGPRARPARGQREDRPPPVPNPDYEPTRESHTSPLFLQPIRKGQREVYAGLEPRSF
ncbi:UNVERIFIED_CONTAM: hypothetical protein K2H54_002349 [Gekko kuhli]